jgi:nucleotide-binding universal stress UspA family protein
MFKNIVVPVDLAHQEQLERALSVAADLAKHYAADLHCLGVTTSTPGPVAHNPSEFADKLSAFAKQVSEKQGIEFKAHAYNSHDPAVDLDETLMKAMNELGADLAVMGSHKPGLPEHIFASNAGYLASHATISVLVVR